MADLARLFTFSNTPANTNPIDADQVNAEFNQLVARINALPSTALKPTVGFAKASADLNLTTSLVDLTSATVTVTPDKPGILLVLAMWDFDMSSSGAIAGWQGTGDLLVDGASQGQAVATSEQRPSAGTTVNSGRLTKTMGYAIALTAAGHTIKMQARRGGGASETGGSCFCRSQNSGFLYFLVAS